MTQCIDKPTRGDNILDVLLTNNDRTIGCIKSTESCLSDHNLVEITLRYNPGKGFKPRTGPVWDPMTYRGRNLETAGFDDIRAELDEVDWDQMIHLNVRRLVMVTVTVPTLLTYFGRKYFKRVSHTLNRKRPLATLEVQGTKDCLKDKGISSRRAT